MQRPDSHTGATEFVVRVEDRCSPALSGGYEGCELEIGVPSLTAARTLAAALLEGNDAEQLREGETYVRARAGGRRTVTLRSVG